MFTFEEKCVHLSHGYQLMLTDVQDGLFGHGYGMLYVLDRNPSEMAKPTF